MRDLYLRLYPWFRKHYQMNPADVRACTPRELHRFIQAWADAQPAYQEWDD